MVEEMKQDKASELEKQKSEKDNEIADQKTKMQQEREVSETILKCQKLALAISN